MHEHGGQQRPANAAAAFVAVVLCAQALAGCRPGTGVSAGAGPEIAATSPAVASPSTSPLASVAGCDIGIPTTGIGESHRTDPRFLSAIGTVNAVMIFVDFSDNPANMVQPAAYRQPQSYVEFFRDAPKYLKAASYGRLNLAITPVDHWYRMSKNSREYGIRRGSDTPNNTAYLREAVTLADPDVDFSRFQIVYIMPSRNAPGIELSPGLLIDPYDPVTTAEGSVTLGVTFGSDMWTRPPELLLSHETIHLFGVADLYVNGTDPFLYTGGWDLMGNLEGGAPDPMAWHRWKLGWLDDHQIDCVTGPGTTTHHLTPVEIPGGTKAIVVRRDDNRVWVLESRQRTYPDERACSEGVLVYSVDTATVTQEGPVRIVDSRPHSGGYDDGGRGYCKEVDDAPYGTGTADLPGPAKITFTVAHTATSDDVTLTWAPDPIR